MQQRGVTNFLHLLGGEMSPAVGSCLGAVHGIRKAHGHIGNALRMA